MKNNPIYKALEETATIDPSSLATGIGEVKTMTVTGATVGNFVIVAAPYDLQGITVTGYVSAANTVSIKLHNGTVGTVDLASGTWKVRVLK